MHQILILRKIHVRNIFTSIRNAFLGRILRPHKLTRNSAQNKWSKRFAINWTIQNRLEAN